MAAPIVSPSPPVAAIPGAGAPPSSEAWSAAFGAALPYTAFLDRHATADQRARWSAVA